MTLAERYRSEYKNPQRPMATIADWLSLMMQVDPDATVTNSDIGVYIEFTDGSVWRLGSADHNAGAMLS